MSIVERYLIQCPFIGGSSLRGSTINNHLLSHNYIIRTHAFSSSAILVQELNLNFSLSTAMTLTVLHIILLNSYKLYMYMYA